MLRLRGARSLWTFVAPLIQMYRLSYLYQPQGLAESASRCAAGRPPETVTCRFLRYYGYVAGPVHGKLPTDCTALQRDGNCRPGEETANNGSGM